MKIARWIALWALPVCMAFAPSKVGAQIDPLSDILFETIRDQNGNTVNFPLSFGIFESQENGQPIRFTIPALTVDFLEEDGSGNISDRFHFDDYTVDITSDQDPGCLQRRTNAFLVQGEWLRTHHFLAISDDSGTGNTSDILRITLDPLGILVDTHLLEFPEPEGVSFIIFPLQYDLFDPAEGCISDYVDIGQISGFFISSDNQADYDPALVVNGTVQEVVDGRASLGYTLTFASVPEPGTLSLLFAGLSVLSACAWRKRRCSR